VTASGGVRRNLTISPSRDSIDSVETNPQCAVTRCKHRTYTSSLKNAGFVLKKRPRPSEPDRPDVAARRATFLKWMRRQVPNRLVFVDEAGANIAMGRSHAWGKRGDLMAECK
jgi:hypothetical protein